MSMAIGIKTMGMLAHEAKLTRGHREKLRKATVEGWKLILD